MPPRKPGNRKRPTRRAVSPKRHRKRMPRRRQNNRLRRLFSWLPFVQKTGRRRKKGEPFHFGRFLLKWTTIFAIWGLIAVTVILAWYAHDLPPIGSLNVIEKRPSITIKARDGLIISTYGDVYGDYVSFNQLPWYLPAAVIATEDRRYYSHFGIDIIGLARAAWVNYQAGRIVQGGSTITQQLAKNIFLTSDRTIKRKIQEMILAVWLESKFTKEEILTIYLNRVYFGAGTYGVDAAAKRYFDKPASQLTLKESAVLAGLLKAPSRYAPTRNADRANSRANLVLDNMLAAGFLSPEETAEAKNESLATASYRPGSHGSFYFGDWLVDHLPDYIGHVDTDIEVITTLDPTLQRVAEESLETTLKDHGEEKNVSQGAIVVMTPNGAIQAMVGGRNYLQSQFNRATQARRQPGSAFKAFVYLAAIQAGLSPNTRIVDGPVQIDDWEPSNYSDRFYGEVTLREAFAKSINTVAVQVSESIGRKRVIEVARKLGITAPLTDQPSIALGTNEITLLEMTGAYAHFASGGEAVWPFGVYEIRDRKGNVLYQRTSGGAGNIIPREDIYQMNDLMRAVTEHGTGRAARLPNRPTAGKTGTSQDFRDAWFMGYTPQYVAGVWLGNDDYSPMKKVTGGALPARTWKKVMLAAHEGLPVLDIPRESPVGWLDILGFSDDRPKRGGSDRGSLWDKFSDMFEGEETQPPAPVEYKYPSERRRN